MCAQLGRGACRKKWLQRLPRLRPTAWRARVVARHKKTREIIETAREMLAEHNPMTVRQFFYQTDSRGRIG